MRTLPYRVLAAGGWAVSTAWGAHLPWLPAPRPGLSVAAAGRGHPVPAAAHRVLRSVAGRTLGVAATRTLRNQRVLNSLAGQPLPRRPVASLLRERRPGTDASPVLTLHNSLTGLSRPDVRCDKCVASAATAEMGEDSIVATIDVRAVTSVTMGNAVLRLTSVRPFSVLFRQPF